MVIHETVAWALVGATTRWGIPVTGAARTLVDLAAVEADEMVLQRALDEVRRKRLASWGDLWETFVLHARRGRPGIAMCRSVLERRFGRTVPDTEFARLFMRLLEDAGLPEPLAEHWVVVDGRRYRLDLAYAEQHIAIELDGKETHFTEAAFESDPVRDNRLRLGGWLVLHYTWRRFVDAPGEIVSELRAALADPFLRSFCPVSGQNERRNDWG